MCHGSNKSSNSSRGTSSEDRAILDKLPIVMIYSLISVVSILLNGFIVSLFCKKARLLLKKRSNCLLLSLSVCDFFTAIGLILITLNVVVGNDVLPIVYRILVDIYEAFLVKTLLFHLCGLTLDRYIALFFALRYEAITTYSNVRRFIIASRVIPFLVSALQLTWLHGVISGSYSDTLICEIDVWFSWISFFIFLALPMILLAVGFMLMISEIQRIIRETPGLEDRSAPKEKRAIYIFSLMYLTFLLLVMPYYSIRLWIDSYYHQHSVEPAYNGNMMRIVVALKYSTSIIRPALYGFTSSEIRMESKKMKEQFKQGFNHHEYPREPDLMEDLNGNSTVSFIGSPDIPDTAKQLHQKLKQSIWRSLSLENAADLSKVRSETELTDLP